MLVQSKLTGLKQQLWENLRAERVKNFKEEQERLKAQEEMDEDNYLDKMDKELEDEQMPPGMRLILICWLCENGIDQIL